jgi:hypothetical protein
VQAAAVEALSVIGDGAAIGPLRRMTERELDGRLVRRGREVIRDLQEDTAGAEQLRRLRDELEELRATSVHLRDRVDALELAKEDAERGRGDGAAKKAAKSKRAAKATKAGAAKKRSIASKPVKRKGAAKGAKR